MSMPGTPLRAAGATSTSPPNRERGPSSHQEEDNGEQPCFSSFEYIPVENYRRIRRMFEILDQDGNGYIEDRELKEVHETVHGTASPDSYEAFTKQCGLMTHGNDKIDKIDFHKFKDVLLRMVKGKVDDLEDLCEAFSLGKRLKDLGYSEILWAFDEANDTAPGDRNLALFEPLDTKDTAPGDRNLALFEPKPVRGSARGKTFKYKGLYEPTELNAMHVAVDMCEPGEAGPVEFLIKGLNKEPWEKQVEYLAKPFRYKGKGNSDCEAQAIHLAAAAGKTAALLSLVRASEELIDARAKFNGKDHATPLHDAAWELIDARAKFNGKDHATPLHDAAWGPHADTVKALLEKRARVDIKDNKGMTALHLVANQGEDEQTVKEMISGLLKSGADLREKVATKDKYSAQFHKKTAAEIAANRGLSNNFPMKALHMLMPNFAAVASGRDPSALLLKDISAAAECGHEQGQALVRAMLDKEYKKKAFEQAMEAPDVLHTLARLTVRRPELGAALLDALTDTPRVEDAKTYPLPPLVSLTSFMGLSATPMRCVYVADVDEHGWPQWKKPPAPAKDAEASGAQAWQLQWSEKSKGNYPVKVQVIHVPNILDKEMVQALALTPSWCVEIFAQKSVQAVVTAAWDQVRSTYAIDLLFNFLILPLLLGYGIWDPRGAWWKHSVVRWPLLIFSIGDVASLCLVQRAFWQTKAKLQEEKEKTWRELLEKIWRAVAGGGGADGEDPAGGGGAAGSEGLGGRETAREGEKAQGKSAKSAFAIVGLFGRQLAKRQRGEGKEGEEVKEGKEGFRISWLRWLASSLNWVVDALACLPLVVLVVISIVQEYYTNWQHLWRFTLALTFLMRCWKVMYMLRGWFTSFNAFFSAFAAVEVMNILLFVALSFLMFCGAFVVWKAETPWETLDSSFQALLFSEGDAIAHLMKVGDKVSLVSKVLVFLGLALFTFCFNSLITAVFSDKYADDDRRSNLAFLNERARLALKCMYLRQGVCDMWQWELAESFSSLLDGHRGWIALCLLPLAWVLGSAWPLEVAIAAVVCIAAARFVPLEAVDQDVGTNDTSEKGASEAVTKKAKGASEAVDKKAKGQDVGTNDTSEKGASEAVAKKAKGASEAVAKKAKGQDRRRFVWLCYREDFDPDVFQYGPLSDDSCKIEKIRQSSDKQADLIEQAMLKMDQMERRVEDLQRDADQVKVRMAQLGDSLERMDVNINTVLQILVEGPEKRGGIREWLRRFRWY